MITVFCTIYDSIDLLPWFLDWYANWLRCDRFVFAVTHGTDNPWWNTLIRTRHKAPIAVVPGHDKGCSGAEDSKKLNEIRHGTEGWHVIADLDEFHQWNGNTAPAMIKYLDFHGADAVLSTLIDYVCVGHKKREAVLLSMQESDLENFATPCALTAHLKGNTDKVSLMRPQVQIGVGHHSASGKYLVNGYVTRHLKWTGGLRDRLQARVDSMADANEPSTIAHRTEMKRALDLISDDGKTMKIPDEAFELLPEQFK